MLLWPQCHNIRFIRWFDLYYRPPHAVQIFFVFSVFTFFNPIFNQTNACIAIEYSRFSSYKIEGEYHTQSFFGSQSPSPLRIMKYGFRWQWSFKPLGRLLLVEIAFGHGHARVRTRLRSDGINTSFSCEPCPRTDQTKIEIVAGIAPSCKNAVSPIYASG